MAELDYAYLADFVALQDGKLTSVGASFTFAMVPSVPLQMQLGIGGRVRAKVDEGDVAIEIRIAAPNDSLMLTLSGDLRAGDMARPYGDGMVGLLFAINTPIPIEEPGLYTFDISIQGAPARRLAFEIELADQS